MFEQTFKNIDDILHKDAGCTSELDYTEQSSWLLFLKYLDDLEADKAAEAELEGRPYRYILDVPYRWSGWAAPKGPDGPRERSSGGRSWDCARRGQRNRVPELDRLGHVLRTFSYSFGNLIVESDRAAKRIRHEITRKIGVDNVYQHDQGNTPHVAE
jgi:hypothetical protein